MASTYGLRCATEHVERFGQHSLTPQRFYTELLEYTTIAGSYIADTETTRDLETDHFDQ